MPIFCTYQPSKLDPCFKFGSGSAAATDPAAFSTRFRIQLQKLCKQLVKLHYEELSVDEKNIKNCSKVKNHKVGSNLL